MASADLPPDPFPAPLPITRFDSGALWWRVHHTARHPVFFGPRPGDPPANRFDAPNGDYRVLYLGLDFEASFVETLLREPRESAVETRNIAIRSISILHNTNELSLVDLTGPGLAQIGADNRLSTGPYDICAQWALALWRHADAPDGLLYRSRHDPHLICAAIFDRPRATFDVSSTKALMDIPREWAPLLAARHKGFV